MTFNLAENLNNYSEELGVEESLTVAIDKSELKDIPHLLKRIAEEPQSEVERSMLIDKLSQKVNIPKRVINKELKRLMPPIPTKEENQVGKSALFKGLVDMVIDDDGKPVYLVKEGESLVMKKKYCINESLVIPPDKERLPFELVYGREVIDWYEKDKHQILFGDVESYLKRFSYTTDDQFLILVCFAFATYLQDHKNVDYIPTIYFYAAPEHGKTRTGKSMTYICYRGIHCVDLREASIFRFSDRLQSTLFFDIMDLWKQIERSGSQDIILLRNEKGAKVSRVLNPDRGAFEDMTIFKIFGPTIIASNKDIHTILGTRCISIDMPHMPGYYENPSPDEASKIKARLIAWRAHYMDQPLAQIDVVPAITGRLWDISKPLLQICKMLCPQRYDELIAALTIIAESKKQEKSESFEAKIISIINNMFTEAKASGYPNPMIIGTSRVLERVNEGLREEFKITSQGFGRKLKAIGIKTTITGGYSKITIEEEELVKLMEQYGLESNFEETK
jgi:hypothetical protein